MNQAVSATFATISQRMKLNFFARESAPESPPAPAATPAPAKTGQTFPADEVVWGITIRNGFDELDDPWYHRGLTQHAYLEGTDNASICGFRPPQSGPRTRRRARLGLPAAGEHPMCGMCARMVVAPRPRVPVPVQAGKPVVAVPVRPDVPRPAPAPVGVAPRAAVSASAEAKPSIDTVPAANGSGPTRQEAPDVSESAPDAESAPMSPWVHGVDGIDTSPRGTPNSGLLRRGIHTEYRD